MSVIGEWINGPEGRFWGVALAFIAFVASFIVFLGVVFP